MLVGDQAGQRFGSHHDHLLRSKARLDGGGTGAPRHQLEYADLVITSGGLSPRAAALLEHLVAPGCPRGDLHELDAAALVSGRRDPDADARVDPRQVRPTGALGEHGVWTVDLSSWRPLHPQRLLERIETLGAGRLRGRGAFWLPTRPGVACAWDGAGGQLSIGSVGLWGGVAPHTRLVITGVDEDPRRLLDAFDAVLMTGAELARGLDWWVGCPDEFDTWLGEQSEAA